MLSKLIVLLAACGLIIRSVDAASAVTDLTNFVSGSGVRVIRASAVSRTGYDVALVGDFNNDGYADFVTGAYQGNVVLIILGRPTSTPFAPIDTDTAVSGQFIQKVTGPSSWFGTSTGAAGDINNDGYDDVIIGAGQSTAGKAFIVYGKAGPYTDIAYITAWSTFSVGVAVNGPTNVNFARYPRMVRGLGDVDGDGYDDFAVAASTGTGTSSRSGTGSVWVFFGKNSKATANYETSTLGSTGILFGGAAINDNLGYTLNGNMGDFNGDGKNDILMGAPAYDPFVGGASRVDAGAVYMIFGSSTIRNTVNNDLLSFTTGAQGVLFLGEAAGVKLGYAASFVGDLNNDGFDDIALGANSAKPLNKNGAGRIYVIYGTNVVYTADVDLLTFSAGPLGFSIYGSAAALSLSTAAPAGDINQDGFKDMVVGGSGSNSKVHIVYGTGSKPIADIDLNTANVQTFTAPSASSLGWAVDGGQDVNGDGIPDLFISAYTQTLTEEGGTTSFSSAGAAYLLTGPFILPSDAPTQAPSQANLDPSAVPSAIPTRSPTTAAPSAPPSVGPSAVPSAVPSAGPSAVPTLVPTAGPTAIPTYTVTVSPTALNPTVDPTAVPSVAPSAVPSAIPSAIPSAAPSATPTATPSANPSPVPTAPPSLMPSAVPSAVPTRAPSAAPTFAPTADPSAVPTADPSAVPTDVPTASPSVTPSVAPSAAPTQDPTVSPTADPTIDPTAAPTVAPTVSPTADPTVDPTAAPSAAPTVRPTPVSGKNIEVKVTVEQTVYFMSEANYNAQKVEYNRTIQATVAASMDGVTPDRVTDIVVGAASASTRSNGVRGSANLRQINAVDQCSLKYSVRVNDPVLTFEALRDQLSSAAAAGQMDTDLRHYASVFGAANLNNGTFAAPQVTNAAVMRPNSEKLTGAEIAGLVIGVVLFVALLATLVMFVVHTKKASEQE